MVLAIEERADDSELGDSIGSGVENDIPRSPGPHFYLQISTFNNPTTHQPIQQQIQVRNLAFV